MNTTDGKTPDSRLPTVVYIDDDDGDLELFTVAVSHTTAGARIVTFRDAAEALAFCRSLTAPIDLVVVDVNMPRTDGFQFLRELRRYPTQDATPVVFLSNSDDPTLMLEAREAGAAGYFVKPLGFVRYARMIRGLLAVPDRLSAPRFPLR